MVVWIVVFNVAIAAFNGYLVWKICRWRRCLRHTHHTLIRIERQARRILQPTPLILHQGAIHAQNTRSAYQTLQRQTHQLQQLLTLLNLLLDILTGLKPR
ncbi:hypothetical protein PN441_11325 [Spirulina major CS-329]|nr:hypothetical protein [Spirulina subsalsa CS-330]MDB9503662.1 hypothetical protein [Spirulina major CS-329]